MVYILGVEINEKKPIGHTLCKLYGINYTVALQICSVVGMNPLLPLSKRCIKLGLFQDIQSYISKQYNIGTVLQKTVRDFVKKEIQIKSYKGMRHRLKLPVRGQRTHTNRMSQRRSTLI